MRRTPLAVRASRSDSGYLLHVRVFDPLPSELHTVRARPRETGNHPLADHGALEFGEDPHHLEHRPPRWRARIEPLLVQEQVNALGAPFIIASRPGRASRPLAPEMPASSKTATTSHPCRAATASNSRRWLSVVCSAVETSK
jgi:hypothetical protein